MSKKPQNVYTVWRNYSVSSNLTQHEKYVNHHPGIIYNVVNLKQIKYPRVKYVFMMTVSLEKNGILVNY